MRCPSLILRSVAALATLVALACGDARHPSAPGAAPVVTAPLVSVSASDFAQVLEVTGSVEPARRAAPGTLLAGRIVRVLRREGEAVRSQETLAVVESGEVQARVAQADAGVVAARVAEENARRMRERMERLVARQAASRKNLEDAVGAHEGALAALRAAEEGGRAARVQLGYARVVAPFAGLVVQRLVEVGDMAGPGVPLFVIEDRKTMKVEAAVPESAAYDLRAGAPVTLIIDGAPGNPRRAALSEILPATDAASRTVTARVLIDNHDGALRSGAFARVTFPGTRGRAALSIPEGALVRRGPLAGVFVVDEGGVARLRFVTLGEAREGALEVLTGLRAAERIVAAPPPGLEDGTRVEGAR